MKQFDKPSIDLIFRALGDPTRREIIEILSEKPVSVTQLAVPLNISLAAVVQHLQLLETSGLVRTEKIGRTRTCRIEPNGLALAGKWIENRRTLWERRLDQLDLYLKTQKEKKS